MNESEYTALNSHLNFVGIDVSGLLGWGRSNPASKGMTIIKAFITAIDITTFGKDYIRAWIHRQPMVDFVNELMALLKPEGGLHGNLAHFVATQMEEYSMAALATRLSDQSPRLWSLVMGLLNIHGDQCHRVAKKSQKDEQAELAETCGRYRNWVREGLSWPSVAPRTE